MAVPQDIVEAVRLYEAAADAEAVTRAAEAVASEAALVVVGSTKSTLGMLGILARR